MQAGLHHNLPFGGKLGGVTEQVEQDLLDLVLIGLERRQIGGQIGDELDIRLEQGLGSGVTEIDEIVNGKGRGLHIHASRFDLGNVQNGVDQMQQMVGAG